ncbi:MAG: hypothetical protein R3Y35_01840 [Clostridia bacterium]
MKKILMFTMIAVFTMTLTACSSDTDTQTDVNEDTSSENVENEEDEIEQENEEDITIDDEENIIFTYGGVDIQMGVNFADVYDDLGEENSYFEAASCAFDGLDKIYYYSGIEISTYPEGDEDFVSVISLKDDTIETDAGVYIGMNIDMALELQGSDYTVDGVAYTYSFANSYLTFFTEDDTIIAITYGVNQE